MVGLNSGPFFNIQFCIHSGDSGGPLIVADSVGRFTLVGITSAGFGCGIDHQPGIYHNVQLTTKWIHDVIYNKYF